MFTPGYISREEAATLNRLLQRLDSITDSYSEETPIQESFHGGLVADRSLEIEYLNMPFRAQLTSAKSSSGFYSWSEVAADGADQNNAPRLWRSHTRDGTLLDQPAYEANGNTAKNGQIVEMRRSYLDATLGWVYVFDASGSQNSVASAFKNWTTTHVCAHKDYYESELDALTNISSSTPSDLSNAEITYVLNHDTKVLIRGYFDWSAGDDGDVYYGILDIDNIDQLHKCVYHSTGSNSGGTFSQEWMLTQVAGTYTAKLEASRHSGTGTGTLSLGNSKIVVQPLIVLIAEQSLYSLPESSSVLSVQCLTDPLDCCDGSESGSGAQSGSGSGSGGGGGGGDPVQTDCCANSVPNTLTVTVTNKTGTCTCLPDSFEIVSEGANWTVTLTECGSADFIIECISSGSVSCGDFSIASTLCSSSSIPDSCSCDPFELVFNSVSFTGCCNGTAKLTVTE